MKRLELKWFKKPDKKLELTKDSILVATHKGDVSYLRYVKFKQLAPQFWEKMDSPLFATYLDRYEDAYDQSKYAKAHAVLLDYKMAIDNAKNSYDAWGLCFALICYEKDEEVSKEMNDIDLKEKLARLAKKGLTADMIYEGVTDFMKASPETFLAHLELLEAQKTMIATVL